MRISLIIDCRAIQNSGIGVYLRKLLPHILKDPGFRICLLGRKQELEAAVGEEAVNMAAIVECRAGIYSVREQAEIPLRVPQCDVFWSPHYNIPILPIRAKHRVTTIHDAYHLAFIHSLRTIERMYARVVLPLAACLSERVITVSSFSKAEIVRYTGVRPEKVEVIHNGVDFPAGDSSHDDYPVVPSGRYLLYVGNVKPHKNIVGLVNAFAIFSKSFPDVQLVIAGRKGNFIHGIQNLSELITGLGIEEHIVFTGFVGDDALCALYKRAFAFVFPSFYEGFGLPPLEAMASGIPVIASRAASIPEVCGDAALYVDPHDPQDIAQAIERVFRDCSLRDGLVLRGRARAQCFSWQASAAKHVKVFEELHGR